MTEIASCAPRQRLDDVAALYHRLILIVGPAGSGKTSALRDVSKKTETTLLNLNLRLSGELLEMTERQRGLKLPGVLEDSVAGNGSLVILDNIEILFDRGLKQDPLRLLQKLSRHRTVVASWTGTVSGGSLTYAAPEHPEYRRYPCTDLVVVTLEGGSANA